jgi:hypothetical protein
MELWCCHTRKLRRQCSSQTSYCRALRASQLEPSASWQLQRQTQAGQAALSILGFSSKAGLWHVLSAASAVLLAPCVQLGPLCRHKSLFPATSLVCDSTSKQRCYWGPVIGCVVVQQKGAAAGAALRLGLTCIHRGCACIAFGTPKRASTTHGTVLC